MIDEQIRDRPVREYLDETNDALNDFDIALGNVSLDISKAISEFFTCWPHSPFYGSRGVALRRYFRYHATSVVRVFGWSSNC